MVCNWSLGNSKSPQVTRTFLSILTNPNNAVIWMFSTRLFLSKSSSPYINPLVNVPRAPITIDIIVTYMFYIFSVPLQGPNINHSFLSVWLCGLLGQQSSQFGKLTSLFFSITRSGRLAEIRWSICISKSQSLCILFSKRDSGLYIYIYIFFFVWSNFNFLHNS